MKQIPKELENLSRSLDLTPEEWSKAMSTVSEFGKKFLSELESVPAIRKATEIDTGRPTPPEDPEKLEKVFSDFSKLALQNGIDPSSGRFFGYIPGGGMPTSALGDAIAALTNRYTGAYSLCPGAVEIENQIVRWIRNLLNWPMASWGTLQSGGSLATLTAVVAARSTRPQSEWQKSTIYCSEETHHCFQKALIIAGLETTPFRKIPCDLKGKMSLDSLKAAIAKDRKQGFSPWILCATAGTVNVGAVDPLEACAEICREEKMWFHIDAAYGGFFWLSDEGKRKLKGMESSDSVILDPHKGLFQPYGLGMVLVKDSAFLQKTLSVQASYLQDAEGPAQTSPMDYSPELTRHFRSLRLWVALKAHGLKAFIAAIEEKLLLARYLYDSLVTLPELFLFSEPELSIVAFRCKGSNPEEANKKTEKLFSELLKSGRVLFSSTKIREYLFLRVCVLSFRSHQKEVDEAIREIKLALSCAQ